MINLINKMKKLEGVDIEVIQKPYGGEKAIFKNKNFKLTLDFRPRQLFNILPNLDNINYLHEYIDLSFITVWGFIDKDRPKIYIYEELKKRLKKWIGKFDGFEVGVYEDIYNWFYEWYNKNLVYIKTISENFEMVRYSDWITCVNDLISLADGIDDVDVIRCEQESVMYYSKIFQMWSFKQFGRDVIIILNTDGTLSFSAGEFAPNFMDYKERGISQCIHGLKVEDGKEVIFDSYNLENRNKLEELLKKGLNSKINP